MSIWLRGREAGAGARRSNIFAVAVVLLLLATAADDAAAATVRVPETGAPALVADLPEGWTVKLKTNPNDVIAHLTSPDGSAWVVLQVGNGIDPALVEDFRVGAQLGPWSKTYPNGFAGVMGSSWESARGGEIPANIRLTVIKIDAGHTGAVAEVRTPQAGAGTAGAVNQIFASVRIER
jgi:hypothetical protein